MLQPRLLRWYWCLTGILATCILRPSHAETYLPCNALIPFAYWVHYLLVFWTTVFVGLALTLCRLRLHTGLLVLPLVRLRDRSGLYRTFIFAVARLGTASCRS